MRLLEVSLVVLLLATVFCRGTYRSLKMRRRLVAAALVTVAIHAVYEGAHWQMIPAYVALAPACLLAWNPDRNRNFSTAMGWLVVLLAITSVGFSFVLPMFRLPKPTGPYPVGTATLYFKDASRLDDASPGGRSPRELMVQVWYPAQPSGNPWMRYRELRESKFVNSYQSQVRTNSRRDAPAVQAGAPFPIVLFDPGWFGRRTQNTALVEDLASHGYFVAAIDHPYNARIVAFPDGRVIRGAPSADIDDPDRSSVDRIRAVWDHELRIWVEDERFVLDRLEAMNGDVGSPWYGRLNTHLEAAVGHSFGGAASTAICAQDARIRGAVDLDGWFLSAIEARGANQPLLVMNEGRAQLISGGGADVEGQLDSVDLAETDASLRRFGGYRVYVNGAHHQDFTDQPLLSPIRRVNDRGTVPAPEMESVVRLYVRAFLDKTLLGDDPAILHPHAAPFPEVELEVWPGEGGEPGSKASRGN